MCHSKNSFREDLVVIEFGRWLSVVIFMVLKCVLKDLTIFESFHWRDDLNRVLSVGKPKKSFFLRKKKFNFKTNSETQRIVQNAIGPKLNHITITRIILFLVTYLNTKRDT